MHRSFSSPLCKGEVRRGLRLTTLSAPNPSPTELLLSFIEGQTLLFDRRNEFRARRRVRPQLDKTRTPPHYRFSIESTQVEILRTVEQEFAIGACL